MIFSVAASCVGLLAFLGHTDEDRGVIALTEPQTWTTIGILAAADLALFRSSPLFLHCDDDQQEPPTDGQVVMARAGSVARQQHRLVA